MRKALEFVVGYIEEEEYRTFLETAEVEPDAEYFRDDLLAVLNETNDIVV
jgi:hypothetical protein